MAFDPNQQDPNKQDQNQQPAQPILPTTSSAPGSGPGASGGKATPQSAPAQPFQNLQSYLTANQPQIQEQGTKIASDLGNQYGQVTSDVDKAKTDFGTQVAGGYAAPNTDITNAAASNPTDFVSKPENVKAFQSLYNDTYTGPDAFETSSGYGNVSGEVGKAAQNASLFNTPEGVQTYFANQSPTATKGGNVLDSVLLQGSPEVYGQVQNAAKPFANLNDYLTGAVTEANQGVTNAKTTAQQTAQGLQSQYTGPGGTIPTFEQGLTDKMNQTRSTIGSAADKAIQDLTSGNSLTPEDLAALGLPTSQSGFMSELQNDIPILKNQYGQNIDLSNFYTKNNPNAIFGTPDTVATSDDYARADALSKLTGQDLSSFLNPNLASKAGTTRQNLIDFNPSGAMEGVTTNLKNLDNQTITGALNSAPGFTGQDPKVVFSNPNNVAAFKSSLSPTDFSNLMASLTRSGITPATPGTTPGTPGTPSTPPPPPTPNNGDTRINPNWDSNKSASQQPGVTFTQKYNASTGQWENYTEPITGGSLRSS